MRSTGVTQASAAQPAYIDKSYLQDALGRTNFPSQPIRGHKEKYMLYVVPILADGKTVGLVAIGKGLDQLERILGNQLFLSLVTGLLSVFVFDLICSLCLSS